jgi:hypothetical protein
LVLGTLLKICEENPNLVKIGQKYGTLYVKAGVSFIVAGDKRNGIGHSE